MKIDIKKQLAELEVAADPQKDLKVYLEAQEYEVNYESEMLCNFRNPRSRAFASFSTNHRIQANSNSHSISNYRIQANSNS